MDRVWRVRARVLGIVAGIGLLVSSCSVAATAHAAERAEAARVDYPAAESCVQAADLGDGGVFLESDSAAVMVGTHCRYTAATSGGYLVMPTPAWHVRIERPDGTVRLYSAAGRSPRCATDVIARGDRVEIASMTSIAAGNRVGCDS
jgi:hypothetical protein